MFNDLEAVKTTIFFDKEDKALLEKVCDESFCTVQEFVQLAVDKEMQIVRENSR